MQNCFWCAECDPNMKLGFTWREFVSCRLWNRNKCFSYTGSSLFQSYCRSMPNCPVKCRKAGLSGSYIYLDPLLSLLIASFYPNKRLELVIKIAYCCCCHQSIKTLSFLSCLSPQLWNKLSFPIQENTWCFLEYRQNISS